MTRDRTIAAEKREAQTTERPSSEIMSVIEATWFAKSSTTPSIAPDGLTTKR